MSAAVRKASLRRDTAETKIALEVNLDGAGTSEIATGVAFFDHMLTLFSRHSLVDLKVKATGDTDVDYHHTVEDVGIVLGQAVRQALGDFRGIRRFGLAVIPMDETLTRCAIDLSNRPYLVWRTTFPTPKVGEMDTELFKEFHHAFASNAGACVHLETFYGANSHHIAESGFKALGRALREAVEIDPRAGGQAPSTKGSL
jgi:imidazoleglycerol-phosphate dehydratase